jgi:predicted MPP superfamily phosphohydrolase
MARSAVLFSCALLVGAGELAASRGDSPKIVQFVFTSDAHYGITRPAFRGGVNVDAKAVNAAMIEKINTLSGLTLARDGGVNAGRTIGPVDFVVVGGDVANRSEFLAAGPIQSAAASWAQFKTDYLEGLTLVDRLGARIPVYVVPGNHDLSNAVGFYKPMRPLTDNTMLVGIYNLMMKPAIGKTNATYEYPRDRVLTSRDVGGLHFVFLTLWPDSVNRAWLDRDLKRVSATTPVIVFSHDQPEGESKHFMNPNGAHDINAADRFEDLLSDRLQDGSTPETEDLMEQETWEDFARRHSNIKAYFHGNSNWNEFYDWEGPHHSLHLHAFRVDSPMKGRISSVDETRLSFQLATIDTASGRMTVRECFWNADPTSPSGPVAWGALVTVQLR